MKTSNIVALVAVCVFGAMPSARAWFFTGGPVNDASANAKRNFQLADFFNAKNAMMAVQVSTDEAKTIQKERVEAMFGAPLAKAINLPPGPELDAFIISLRAQAKALRDALPPGSPGLATAEAMERQAAMLERQAAFYARLQVVSDRSKRALSLEERLQLQSELQQIVAELLVDRNQQRTIDAMNAAMLKRQHAESRERAAARSAATDTYTR